MILSGDHGDTVARKYFISKPGGESHFEFIVVICLVVQFVGEIFEWLQWIKFEIVNPKKFREEASREL